MLDIKSIFLLLISELDAKMIIEIVKKSGKKPEFTSMNIKEVKEYKDIVRQYVKMS